MSIKSGDSTREKNVENENIRLSEHVKEKLRYRRPTTTTPISTTSDDVFLSNEDEDETASTLTRSSSSQRPLKRDNTFTTYQIQSTRRTPIESQAFVPFERKSTLKHGEICLECQRRDEILIKTRQRLDQIENSNRKLFEQLRSSTFLIHQYQEDNYRLKIRLNQLNQHLKQYQTNFQALHKNLQMKKESLSNVDHFHRLREEIYQYNKKIAAKQQNERRTNDFYSHRGQK